MSKYFSFVGPLVLVTLLASIVSAQRISDTEITGGLKEALSKGVSTAIKTLGKDNGYLGNPRVRIPLPSSIQKLEKGLRLAGQGKSMISSRR